MEDVISSTTTYATENSSESSNNNQLHTKKRPRDEGKACNSTSRFKGVVGQHNGRWGAQIYANKRIWLGTFKSEKEAAMAYDSAAIRLRGEDSHRNFPWTNLTLLEPSFQGEFSTEDILRMIKDGSYPSKFDEFLKEKYEENHPLNTLQGNEVFSYKQLFTKELTPSDVGKLNRLVIPKKFALKYFPQVIGKVDNCENQEFEDSELVFYDTSKRLWKFRYCYWKSSQSFVFTRGWNRFVKDKSLKAKDTIVFNSCEYKIGPDEIYNVFVIDVVKANEVLPMASEFHLQQAIEYDHEVETKECIMKIQSADRVVEPVMLFGQQIGWTERQ